jgi:hypothetical protein
VARNSDLTLQKVDVAGLEKSDVTELWRLIGRAESLTFVSTLSNGAWAETISQLKASKAYRSLGLSWEEFCERHLPFSYKTADRLIADFREFGTLFFTFQEVARVSREAYRQIHSSIDEAGLIQIGDEKLPVNKQTIPAIAAHFAQLQHEIDRHKEDTAAAKAEAKKAREERDSLKKATERLEEEKRELLAKNARPFAKATDAQNLLLRAQSRIVEACELIRAGMLADDYADGDDAWVASLSDFSIKLLVETTGHDPLAMAMMRTAEPQTPLDRYQAEHGSEKVVDLEKKNRKR